MKGAYSSRVSVSILQRFQARECRKEKRRQKIKMTKMKMAFCSLPVVASLGIRGPLHAWQSKEY
jgi:hypothetical protein